MEKSFFNCGLLVVILCFTFTLTNGSKSFKSASVTEGPCSTKSKPAKNFEADWITKVPAWYVQMGSSYFFHQWVERLTNQSSTPEQIMTLCLKLMYLAPDKPHGHYMVVAGGLGKAVAYRCHAVAPHTQTCESVPGSPMYKTGNEYEDLIVATDNKHYLLVFRCEIEKRKKSWYVLTPSTEDLTMQVRKEALVFAVKNGGFDKKYASMISYEKCPKPNIPSPTGDAIMAELEKQNAQRAAMLAADNSTHTAGPAAHKPAHKG